MRSVHPTVEVFHKRSRNVSHSRNKNNGKNAFTGFFFSSKRSSASSRFIELLLEIAILGVRNETLREMHPEQLNLLRFGIFENHAKDDAFLSISKHFPLCAVYWSAGRENMYMRHMARDFTRERRCSPAFPTTNGAKYTDLIFNCKRSSFCSHLRVFEKNTSSEQKSHSLSAAALNKLQAPAVCKIDGPHKQRCGVAKSKLRSEAVDGVSRATRVNPLPFD